MNAQKYLLAAAIAAVGLASAAPASACEAHHPAATEQAALDVKSAPSEMPKARGERGPQSLRVDLETVEAASTLEEGTSYNQRIPAKE